MDEKRIAIIGHGMVGRSSGYALGILTDDCFSSQNKDTLIERIKNGKYGIFILCLPTPTIEGAQNLLAIGEWLEIIKTNYPESSPEPLIVIRSTILPGTTRKLSEVYGLKIAHVPEFLSEATAIDDELNPKFLVIGANDILVREKTKNLFTLLTGSKIQPKRLIMCDSVTAEAIKYSLNSFFALKVIYANQLWDMAVKAGADYEKIKEVLTKHKWGSKNGWDVWHKGVRGYGGNCLPKDVEALINAFELPLLKEAERINKELIGK